MDNKNKDDFSVPNEDKATNTEVQKYTRLTFGTVLKTELFNSIAKSKKHLLRFFLICFMSFIYGIICITGVWDPISRIDQVPVAIVNRDAPSCFAYISTIKGGNEFIDDAKEVSYFDNAKNSSECGGLAKQWFETGGFDKTVYELNYRYASLIDDIMTNGSAYNPATKQITKSVGDINTNINYLSGDDAYFSPQSKYWVQLNIPQNYTLNTYKLMRGLSLIGTTNFSANEEDNLYKAMDFFKDNKINLWATYEHSFMIGNIMNMLKSTFGGIATSVLTTISPEALFWLSARQDQGEHFGEYYIIPYNIQNFIMNIVNGINSYDCDGTNNTTVCQDASGNPISSNLYQALQKLKKDNEELYNSVVLMFHHIKYDEFVKFDAVLVKKSMTFAELLPKAFEIMLPNLGPIPDKKDVEKSLWGKKVYWSDYKSKLLSVTNYFISDAQASQKINTHIQGKEFGTYGYGLGLYFISISLWVGAMLQTFIYSKKSYTKNAKWHQYYLAKWVTMIMTSYAQVLLLFIGLLAVGYGNLGSPILYMLMWMVITATVLTTITQALWYCLPDVNSGRFLCIMYTVFNLAAGGVVSPQFYKINSLKELAILCHSPIQFVV